MTNEPLRCLRDRVALAIAPWLFVPYREDREEAFRDLAEIAYGSRDAVWTSPAVLVEVALRETRREAARGAEIPVGEITGHFGRSPKQPWAWRVQREALDSSSFWCGCSCGWIETGWPNYGIAKRSMNAHLEKVHGSSEVAR